MPECQAEQRVQFILFLHPHKQQIPLGQYQLGQYRLLWNCSKGLDRIKKVQHRLGRAEPQPAGPKY